MPTNPYRSFRYRIEIDGITTGAFSEASIADSTTESFDYREGTDPPHVRKLSGLTSYGTVTFKRGLTDSMELYAWRQLITDRGAEADGGRRSVSVVLLNGEGSDAARWDFLNAWPSKYETSGLNATGNEAMIETLELTVESMTRVA